MTKDQIFETMEYYLSKKEMAGGALIVRRNRKFLYKNK